MSNRTRTASDIRRRAYSTLRIKKQDASQRIIEGVATTPTPDRMCDIVEPRGASFKLPLPLLWQHDPNQPVGHVIEAEVTDDGIRFKAKIESIDEPGRLKDRLDEAWQSVSRGLVRGVSIGFSAKGSPEFLRSGGLRFLEWDWFELSLVTIPANEEATIERVKSLGKAQRRAALGRPSSPGVTGSRKPPAQGDPAMAKSVAEKIREIEEEIEAHKARVKEIMDEAEEEERELEEDEEKEIDEEQEKAAAKERRLKRLKFVVGNDDQPRGTFRRVADVNTREKASRSRGDEDNRVAAQPKRHEEKGLTFARMVKCVALSKGNPMQALEIAKHLYPNEKGVQMYFKAQVAGASVEDPAWAGYLAEPDNFMAAFIDYLRPQTIVGKFGTDGIPSLRRVPFNIKVPRQTSGGTADWVGEGKAKPVTSWVFDQVELRFHKLAAITVLSEELLRHAHMSADTMIRDELAKAITAKMDADFITPGIAGSAVRPGSITNSATTYTSLGVTADDVRADLARMLAVVQAANIPTSQLVLVMRETQASKLSLMRNALGVKEFPDMKLAGGILENIPVVASQNVPQGQVTLVAAGEIFLADDGGVAIDMSREASIEMASDPSNAVTDYASPPQPAEATMVSMFQTNSIAIRAERTITWLRSRDAGVVYQTSTGWGNLDTSPAQPAV